MHLASEAVDEVFAHQFPHQPSHDVPRLLPKPPPRPPPAILLLRRLLRAAAAAATVVLVFFVPRFLAILVAPANLALALVLILVVVAAWAVAAREGGGGSHEDELVLGAGEEHIHAPLVAMEKAHLDRPKGAAERKTEIKNVRER